MTTITSESDHKNISPRQQTNGEDPHLSFEVIPESGGPEPVVEDGPDLLQLADHLVSSGVVEVTLGRDLVQSSPVLTLQLREDLLGTFLGFLPCNRK